MTRFADVLDAFDHAHAIVRPLAPAWIARDGTEYVVASGQKPPRPMVLLATVGVFGGVDVREARREARQRRERRRSSTEHTQPVDSGANGAHEKVDIFGFDL